MLQNQNVEEYGIHRMLEIMKEMMVSRKWRQASKLENVLEEELIVYICSLLDIPQMSFERHIVLKDKKIFELYESLCKEHEQCCTSLDFAFEDGREVWEIVQECNVYCFFFLEELIRHIEQVYGKIDKMFCLPDFSEFEGIE